MSEQLLLDIKQAAAMLAVSVTTIKRQRDAGKFPQPVRLGRALRWRLVDIKAFVANLAGEKL